MTSNKPVSVGVVGTSWWADSMYLPALSNHPGAQVSAVCGRNAQRAADFAKQWGIPQHYTDYREMIDSGEVDAVIVSTNNQSHYPITMYALERGLHVLCEKPLALTYAQAREMADLAEAKGVHNMVPFTYSFMPTARYLKELIDGGYIGSPYHLNMRYYTGYARKSAYDWRFDLSEAGGGIVSDIGSHFLYIARWLYGEISAVQALLGYQVKRGPRPDGQDYQQADDSAVISLEFENGAQGVIHVSAMCYEGTSFGQTHHMEFHGSQGTLYSFTDWDNVQTVSGTRDGDGPVQDLPIPDHIWGRARRDTVHNTYRDVFREENFMTRAFITAIQDGVPARPTFREGARIQQIIEALQHSAATGCRVVLD